VEPPLQRPYSLSVAGVVVNSEGRVLVVRRRDTGRWEPPGGVLEPDETIEQGVVREILEETGVVVSVERLTGVYQNVPRRIVALVFRCSPIDGSPRATEESAESCWAEPGEIENLMVPAYAVRVTDALGSHAAVRAHDGERLLD
jgi:8-oxo-dGTP diphosphatase